MSAVRTFRATLAVAGLVLAMSMTGAVAQEGPAAEEPAAPAVVEEPASPAQVEADAPAAQQPADEAPADGAPADAAEEPAGEMAEFPQDEEIEEPGVLRHDMSPWGMFLAADIVVKAVMVGLAFASLVTWTVWLAKSLELAGAKRRAVRALGRIIEARTLDEAAIALDKSGGPAALLVRAARHETAMSEGALDHGGAAGLKERVTSHLSRIEAQAARRMTRGTGLLATIGSTAPFVGLFGTVWGIMNSFIGIAEAQTTNLAVVAPGIAEALFATAMGLVAAIPAVVIYNVFARSIAGYRLILADASAAVERLVSRDLDYRAVPGRGQARAAE